MSKRRNQSFYARQRWARFFAREARMFHDLWLLREAREYGRSGYVGPTLAPHIDWHSGRTDVLPPHATLGSLMAWDAEVAETPLKGR